MFLIGGLFGPLSPFGTEALAKGDSGFGPLFPILLTPLLVFSGSLPSVRSSSMLALLSLFRLANASDVVEACLTAIRVYSHALDLFSAPFA